MLSFFKVNAPYHIVSLIIIMIVLQLPFYLKGMPLLVPELQWMLVGEKMGQGFMLYRDIWDSISPLSAAVYWAIDKMTGRSQIAYHTIANVLIIFQAIYFNYITNQRQLFTERNYIPGILYLLFINLSFDCSTLSPALMATTFLLLAFGTLIGQLHRDTTTDEVFELGFYVAMATLFHIPCVVFVLWAIVSLIFYSGISFRQYALGGLDFFMPISLLFIFFYFTDALDDTFRSLTISFFSTFNYSLTDFKSVAIILWSIFTLGILGLIKTVSYPRFINYQIRCQQIMVFWLISAIISIGLMPYLAPMQFIVVIPALAYFSVNLFVLMRRKWVAEVLFLIFFVGVILIRYQSFGIKIFNTDLPHLTVKNALLPSAIKAQKILVIGKDEGEYKDNFPATAYLNWQLARFDFEGLNNYENIISIFKNFSSDPPTYVIDKENIMPSLMQRLPLLQQRYKPTSWKGIYQRI